jgi:hypothetical protein
MINAPQVVVDFGAVATIMSKLPQIECPVAEHFAPGVYMREAFFPAGTLVVGEEHVTDHLNLLLSGTVILFGQDGTLSPLTAPALLVSGPGRKMAYAITDTVWVNIHASSAETSEEAASALIKRTPQ